MGHVARQDQETFHQRRDQHRDHRKGNVRDHVAKAAADGRKAKEGDDRGQRGGKHRHGHAAGGILGGDDGRFAQLAGAGVGVFAHDDGVIHHDAGGDDQRKKRDHVDRQPAQIHQRNRGQHRHRDAGGNPEGGARVQEQKQQDHHKAQAHQPVVQQDVQAAGDRLGPCADQVDRGALGQGLHHLVGDILHHALDLDRIALVGPVDPHRDGRVFAHEIAPQARCALDRDRGHVAHGQVGAIGVRPQHDAGDLVGGPFFDPGADAGIGPGDVARRAGVDLGRDGAGDLGHGDVMGDQVDRGHLDHGLWRGDAADGGAGDAFGEQPGDEFIGKAAQLIHIDGAGDYDIGDPVAPAASADLGVFGFLGQGADRIDRGLHVVAGAGHVPARLELQVDAGAPLGRGRGRAFDAFDRQQRGFHQLDDGAVDILGPGAVPSDGDGDVIDDRVGEELRPHLRHGADAKRQQKHQQQVRGGAVPGEIGQDALGGCRCGDHPSPPSGIRYVRSWRRARGRPQAGSGSGS